MSTDEQDYTDEELLAEARRSRAGSGRGLALWLVLAGLVGGFSSAVLDMEKLSFWEQSAKGQSPTLGCNINPIIGCGLVINKPEGSLLFGIPNPIPGLIVFTALLMFGLLLLARVDVPRWWWAALEVGVVVGVLTVTYLQYDSIHVLGALCPYCMVIWAVIIPTFWLVTARNLQAWFPANGVARFVSSWSLAFIFLHFVVLIAFIWFTFGTRLWA